MERQGDKNSMPNSCPPPRQEILVCYCNETAPPLQNYFMSALLKYFKKFFIRSVFQKCRDLCVLETFGTSLQTNCCQIRTSTTRRQSGVQAAWRRLHKKLHQAKWEYYADECSWHGGPGLAWFGLVSINQNDPSGIVSQTVLIWAKIVRAPDVVVFKCT